MGAGKGYVMNWMDKNKQLPLKNFIVVDPDAIRQKLPEWEAYVATDPETAGDKTQKEAGCIAEILGYRALRDRFNVIFDGSLRDTAWYTSYFQRLRENFPGIRIMILHVVAEKEEVLAHAHDRALQTGRAVPVELIERSMRQVPESVMVLSSCCDFVCRVMNRKGREPEVMREEGATIPPANIDVSWDLVRTLWTEIDLNGDGVLDSEEVPSLFYPEVHDGVLSIVVAETMRIKDVNGDGKLTQKEFWEITEAEGDEAEMSEEENADFARLDLDQDGALNMEELKAWESGRFHVVEAMKKMFELADANADMHLGADELAAASEQLGASDAQYHLIEWAEYHEL